MMIDHDGPPRTESCGAAPLSNPDSVSPRSEKFVTFLFGDNVYAVLAPAVAEVAQPSHLTLLPNSPACLLGIAPFRGEVVAVINLRGLVGEPAMRSASPKAKQLILKKASEDSVAVAFIADAVGEIVTLPLDPIRRTEDLTPLVIGETEVNGRNLRILDHNKALLSLDPAYGF